MVRKYHAVEAGADGDPAAEAIGAEEASDELAGVGARLARQGGPSLYRQITRLVIEQVDAGVLKAGDRVPPQRALSEAWGVSEVTVRRAMRELVDAGYVQRHVGRGTTVLGVQAASEKQLTKLAGRSRVLDGRVEHVGVLFRGLTDGYPFIRPFVEGLGKARGEGAGDVSRAGDGGRVVRLQELPSDGVCGDLSGLDGVVMCSPISMGAVQRCQQDGVAYVLVYSDVDDGASRCVVVDYLPGVLRAVQHLHERGRQRVALVTAADERFSTGQLGDAFLSSMMMCGLSVRDDWMIHAGYDEADGHRATRALLANSDEADRPDAILYASDYQARGGLIAAHELGVDVPGDLSVVGCGCLLREKEWLVPMTSIDLRFERVGASAMAILEGLSRGDNVARRTVVRSDLRVGATS